MHPEQFNELESGRWANPNPSRCECRDGWLLSDYDTFHRCPYHGQGVPHPDSDEGEGKEAFDYAAHWIRIHREAWVYFAQRSGMSPEAFREAVRAYALTSGCGGTLSPREWVDFADEVEEKIWEAEIQREAVAKGFASRLEAAWAAGASFEAGCRRRGVDPETEERTAQTVERDSWYRR